LPNDGIITYLKVFADFSAFIVDFLMHCIRGSQNETIKRIVKGKNPGDVTDGSNDDDVDPAAGVMAKYTLQITLVDSQVK